MNYPPTIERFEDILRLLMVNLANVSLPKEPREIMLVVQQDLADKLPKEVSTKYTGDKIMIVEA